MQRKNRKSNANLTKKKGLTEKERDLLSVIMMSKKGLKATNLKRIYLEKYTLWDLQSTVNRLEEGGFLLKKEELGFEPTYLISAQQRPILESHLSIRPKTGSINEPDGIGIRCCNEFTMLWYLMQVDLMVNYRLFHSPQKTLKLPTLRKTGEAMGLNETAAFTLLNMVRTLSSSRFFDGPEMRSPKHVLDDPQRVMKKIFRLVYYQIRESGSLGREEVGKDNTDFFFEELASLEVETWHSLDQFVFDAKSMLFSANQPFRWIHFSKERIWNILLSELEMLQIVQTFINQNKERYFFLTHLGAFCLETISEQQFLDSMKGHHGMLLVHPNFEVTLVSREVNPQILLELSMFSFPVKLDTMSVFLISRDTVAAGIKRGLRPKDMIEFLYKNSRGKIPQNVEYSILDWAGK